MKSSVITKPHSERILTVKVTQTELADFWERAIHKLKHRVKLPGFREGRAPDELVIKEVGRETVEAEALDIALGDTYFLAVKEHGLHPIASPKIEVKKYVPAATGEDKEEIVLEYTATVIILPEVKVSDIDGIKVEEKQNLSPTDEEVDRVITHLRRQKAIFKEIDRPAAQGDWCDIKYEGTVGGVAMEGMKNDNHPVILGEANLIPGFEEQIIGMKKGESKKFPIRFPKEYHAKAVAGKRAEFTVTINEIKEVVLPELDTVFTSDFGFKEPEALKEAVRQNLVSEMKEQEGVRVREEVLKQLEKRIKADIPPALFDQEVERMVQDIKTRVEEQKLSWEAYLGQIKKTEAELEKELRPQAERNVRLGLALGAVLKEQNIKITDEKQAANTALEWLVEKATSKK